MISFELEKMYVDEKLKLKLANFGSVCSVDDCATKSLHNY